MGVIVSDLRMPVYLRKEEGEPSLQTPSISEFKLKDNDFILDPEILFDYLPQPFRMIDKVHKLFEKCSILKNDAFERFRCWS